MTEPDRVLRLLPPIWIMLLVGLGLRLIWALVAGVHPVSDPGVYETFARNIALHGTYGFQPDQPGAFWAVGGAAIYAGAYLLFGVNDTAVIVVNLLSSALILIGVHDLGRRWFNPTVGRLAALLVALWPTLILFTAVLASELHFIALALMGLMAWDRALAEGAAWPRRLMLLLLSGLALAGAVYCRPVGLLVPAALAVAAVLRSPQRAGPTIVSAVLVTAVIFAAVSPWSARNERVFGEPVFMSTNFWPNFWISNNPTSDGQYMRPPPETREMSEIERSDYLKELILADLRVDPWRFVQRLPVKAWLMHSRETIGVQWNQIALRRMGGETAMTAAKVVTSGWWYVMFAAGLVGAIVLARQRGFWAALLSMPVWLWLYITAIHSVILVGDRFHLPAIPFIAMLAALCLLWLLQRGADRDRG